MIYLALSFASFVLCGYADRSAALISNPCPFYSAEGPIDPVALANRAVHELFFLGQIAEALACHRVALSQIPALMLNQDFVKPIRENLANLETMLGPRRPGFPRVYHNVVERNAGSELVRAIITLASLTFF